MATKCEYISKLFPWKLVSQHIHTLEDSNIYRKTITTHQTLNRARILFVLWLNLALLMCCSGMWRCTWFHWTRAGPVRFTVVQHWSRSARWVSMKASAFRSPLTPWRCALCSCPSARWALRLRRSYWWVSSLSVRGDWEFKCLLDRRLNDKLSVCSCRVLPRWVWQIARGVQRWFTTGWERRWYQVVQSLRGLNRRTSFIADTTTDRRTSNGPEPRYTSDIHDDAEWI